MVRYREILRLTAMGISQRNVAFSVGCAASTVQDVLRAARKVGLEWPLPEDMDDSAIRSRIYPPRDRSDASKAEIDHAWVQRELSRPGVTMTLLWNEYADAAVSQGRQPYMYSAFCHRHRKWAEASPEATMHIRWRPGEWTQVDWAGDTMRVLDLDTGELSYADRISKEIAKARYVICLCATWAGLDKLQDSDGRMQGVTRALEEAHAVGATFVLLSDNLPYDAARFPEADVIVCAYLSSGFDIDPTTGSGSENMPAINANVPAALRAIFGAAGMPGELPINIPALQQDKSGTWAYTDEVLYPRGSGLKWEP